MANECLIQVVCGWIGSFSKVARKHYLQTTDEHFDKSVNQSPKVACNAPQSIPDKGGLK